MLGLSKIILFPPFQPMMWQGALLDPDNNLDCIVYAHGNVLAVGNQGHILHKGDKDQRWYWIDVDKFNAFLNANGCSPNQPVVLKSCNTGRPGHNGIPFAQYLANFRRTPVTAPTRSVWYGPKGPNPIPYGHIDDNPDYGKNPNDPGKYITFQPQ